MKMECTLADIARATNIRPDDAAFALNECGLLMRRMIRQKTTSKQKQNSESSDSSDTPEEEEYIVITREMVEQVAKERSIKIMYLDQSCVLLQ